MSSRGRPGHFAVRRLAALALSLLLLVLSVGSAFAATIQTDLWAYGNGDTVVVTGSGFAPAETVDLVTTDPLGAIVDRGTATTDEAGSVQYQFVLNVTSGGLYDIVATGATSGLSATTQFDPPTPSLTPASHAFPAKNVGSSSAAFSFTLSNAGTKLTVSNHAVTFSGANPGDFTVVPATDPSGKSLSDGDSLTFDVVFTPGGGGSRSATLTVKSNGPDVTATVTGTGVAVDSTPPVITPTVTGTAGTNGWYTSNVSVSWTVSDAQSAITSTTGCGSSSVTVDTAGTTFKCQATSAGGTSEQSVTVKRDATAPTITYVDRTPAANLAGWNKSDVTVHWSCADATSGPAASSVSQTVSGEGANLSSTGTCTDLAGNTASNTQTGIKIDATAPTVVATPDRLPDHNGWYNQPVTVTWSAQAGDLSDNATCDAPTTYSGPDTAAGSLTGHCTDAAGNVASTTFTFSYDATAPSGVSGAPNRLPDHNGWYNQAVDVVFSGNDATSDIDSCTTTTYSGPDGSSVAVQGTCTDKAGNTSSPVASSTFSYDATAPTITITTPADGSKILLNAIVASSYSCSDATSQLDACTGTVASGANLPTGTAGAHSFQVDALDRAGNHASTGYGYQVVYAATGSCLGSPGHGVLQPVNSDGTSVFKQGSTVPAKFRVCDANGVSIGTPGVVASFRLVQRTSGTAVATVDEAVVSTTPDSAFRWSVSDQQWIFNMNTKPLDPKATYLYRITLNDGSTIDFLFGLR